MKGLVQFLGKLWRLFVDDGNMAITLIAWCAAAGLAFPAFVAQSVWGAPLFSLGCLIILFVSVVRTARRGGRR
jgi:hypothetical protein